MSCMLNGHFIPNPPKQPSAKLWPSRDFTLGYSLQGYEDFFTSPAKIVNGEVVDIGLSNRLNSHSHPDEISETTTERERRGKNGISSYGKLLVKNAAAYVEQVYGRDRLTFATLTLPAVTVEESKEISRNWSEIVRRFQQSITRSLSREGLPTAIVCVSEVQSKRFEKTGVLGLHLHMVFVGRHPRQDWVLKPYQIRHLWRRSFPPEFQERSWNSTENVQRVRRSVSAYLSKYLSKGLDVRLETEETQAFREVLPTCWYNCTAKLRSQVKRLILSGAGVSEFLALIVESSYPDALEFLMPIYVEYDGHQFLAGWRGKLTKEAYKYIYGGGSPSLDFLGETFPLGLEPGKFSGF